MAGNIFSDSWYKVAKLQVSLIFNIHVKKQNYRGQNWYILEDNYNNQFYKVTPEAYAFIMRLKPSKSVEEVWESCLLICPESAPTQDEVIHILMSLHHKNLLYFKNKADNLQLHERFLKRKTNELKGQLFSFMYLKIPLWNPDYWLD